MIGCKCLFFSCLPTHHIISVIFLLFPRPIVMYVQILTIVYNVYLYCFTCNERKLNLSKTVKRALKRLLINGNNKIIKSSFCHD